MTTYLRASISDSMLREVDAELLVDNGLEIQVYLPGARCVLWLDRAELAAVIFPAETATT